MLSSAVIRDQSRLGAKVRVNLTRLQVATVLPGHQGQTPRLAKVSERDEGEGVGWGLAGTSSRS